MWIIMSGLELQTGYVFETEDAANKWWDAEKARLLENAIANEIPLQIVQAQLDKVRVLKLTVYQETI